MFLRTTLSKALISYKSEYRTTYIPLAKIRTFEYHKNCQQILDSTIDEIIH